MMLASPALTHLLGELGQEELIQGFQVKTGADVLAHLLSIGRVIGYLRWASARRQWSLKFEGLNFRAFIRERDFSFDQMQLLEEVRRHQGGRTGLTPMAADLMAGIDELQDPEHDLWHVCCGHDLVELLSIGLRRVLGENKDADVQRERLEQQLRLAYEESYFMRTKLRAGIHAWEQRNPPFKILSPVTV